MSVLNVYGSGALGFSVSVLNVYGSGALGVLRVCVECVWLWGALWVLRVCVECVWLWCFGGSPCLC